MQIVLSTAEAVSYVVCVSEMSISANAVHTVTKYHIRNTSKTFLFSICAAYCVCVILFNDKMLPVCVSTCKLKVRVVLVVLFRLCNDLSFFLKTIMHMRLALTH